MNISNYNPIRERIEVKKVDDIVNRMQKLLKFDHKRMKKIRSTMQKQINKYCKEMKYQVDNFVKFLSKNIKITKFLKKLNDQLLKSFKIVKKISTFYRLKLFLSMYQHDIFLFDNLKSIVNNLLPN